MRATGRSSLRSPDLAVACLFLPGIVMPASLRYRPLFHALGGGPPAVAQELVLGDAVPSGGYSIEQEIAALERARHDAGLERVHVYGHSGGGAVALAYVAAHPDRIQSLALDEPSTDFSAEDLSGPDWIELQQIGRLPLAERLPTFRRLQVKPGVPVALPAPLPPWMAPAPARIVTFNEAVPRHRVAPERYRAFRGPVYYSYGSLTRSRYEVLRDRLAGVFARFDAERYDGLHHLHCSHQADPPRVASALRALWARSETG